MRDSLNIVVVGGGTAGWITANILAKEHPEVTVTLIESPDVPIIGVGEGTWPSMRMTLQKLGIPECDMLRFCDASFKQGTRFVDWDQVSSDRCYFHPFSLPLEYSSLNLAEFWAGQNRPQSFANFVSPQIPVIEAHKAPKHGEVPDYAFNVNYGYHFDAGKFSKLLHEFGVNQLGVRYVSANVVGVNAKDNGDISSLDLDTGSEQLGDLFIDCTGTKSLLIGEHYQVEFESVSDVLFNDRAIAAQVPYSSDTDPIYSTTHSTAQEAGWIWDIGLQSRRGIGYVFSSRYQTEEQASETLAAYIRKEAPGADIDAIPFRTLKFAPGHRSEFWKNNCIAVGLSAGFVEPLEASAIALIEQSANSISADLPATREIMSVVAKRFNAKMLYHWEKIIEFLKLHYVLSKRTDSEFWVDNRHPDSVPSSLADKLLIWQQQAPWHEDAPRVDELFPSASYQYVLYGMDFAPSHRNKNKQAAIQRADQALQAVVTQGQQLVQMLPSNRQLLNSI